MSESVTDSVSVAFERTRQGGRGGGVVAVKRADRASRIGVVGVALTNWRGECKIQKQG